MFADLPPYEDDPIEGIFRRCAADPRADKLNLSIGVFRDDSGNAPVLDCVKSAERAVLSRQETKAYVGPAGNPAYCAAIERLVLGDSHPVLSDERIRSVQTPGAGAALRVAAELIRSRNPGARIWFSDPVWLHQVDFFTRAGLAVRQHAYYDRQAHCLDFPGMMDSLEEARPGDVLVLHASCHNPTGEDLPLEAWDQLADWCTDKGVLPLVDIAYQGYGDGLEEDAAGLRAMAACVPEMMVAVSSSKSFAVYRDRVGALMLLHPSGGRKADEMLLHLVDLIRALYFMPPDLGAAVITHILNDTALRARWQEELEAARTRVTGLRRACHDHFSDALPGFDSRYMLRQKGMFSCLPVDDAQRLMLERDHGIYLMPSGRLNFAALSTASIPQLARALAAIGIDTRLTASGS